MKGLGNVVSNLKRYDLLQERVSMLAQSVQRQFIQPLLQGHIALESKVALVAKKVETTERRHPESILTDIIALLTYLSTTIPQLLLDPLRSALLPTLIDDVVAFFSLHSTSSIHDLPAFNNLVNAVTQLESHIINLGWATETRLSKWTQGTSIWFSNRLSTVLLETRNAVLRESKTRKSVLISTGIDISNIPEPVNLPRAVGTDITVDTEQNQEPEPVAENKDDDEPDAWGFDTGDDELDETTEVSLGVDTDSWNWNEENDDITPSAENPDSFPYTLSSIPDSLMRIVEQILNEGIQLRSARYSYGIRMILTVVMRRILS